MNGGREASRRENIASFVGDHETYHLLITSHTPLTERALGPFCHKRGAGDKGGDSSRNRQKSGSFGDF